MRPTRRQERATDTRSDRELVGAIAQGDRDALCRLHARNVAWLSAGLSRRCNDRQLVEEAVQDAFLAVWKQADRYRGEGEVGGWLWGIALRRLIDLLRRKSVRTRPLPWSDTQEMRSAEDAVLLGIEHGELGEALEQLSPELRAVIAATALDGLTNREASVLLGIPVGTVKTRLMRARAQLREVLA